MARKKKSNILEKKNEFFVKFSFNLFFDYNLKKKKILKNKKKKIVIEKVVKTEKKF